MGDKCGDNMCYYLVLLSGPSRVEVIGFEHLALKTVNLHQNRDILHTFAD